MQLEINGANLASSDGYMDQHEINYSSADNFTDIEKEESAFLKEQRMSSMKSVNSGSTPPCRSRKNDY